MKRETFTTLTTMTFVALFALPACKKDAGPGSCFQKERSACVSFDAAHATAGKRMCASGRWIDGADSCPTEGRLGTCFREHAAIKEFLYEGPPNQYTRGLAKQVCETNAGVFEAP